MCMSRQILPKMFLTRNKYLKENEAKMKRFFLQQFLLGTNRTMHMLIKMQKKNQLPKMLTETKSK